MFEIFFVRDYVVWICSEGEIYWERIDTDHSHQNEVKYQTTR